MTERATRIDGEILNLDGGLFTTLPRHEIPLSSYGLGAKVIEPAVDDYATTQVMRRVKLDSLAPMALTAPEIERVSDLPAAPRRAAPWTFLAGVAAGVAMILGGGLVSRARHAGAPESATAALAATPIEAAAAEMREAPIATPAPAPVEATPAEPARVPVVAKAAPAPQQAAPVKAAAPRAPVVAAPAAEPVATADLPSALAELPPPPRAPEVQISRSAVAVAIADAGLRAGACKDGEIASMSMPVSVTFMPSGRASRATVNGGPFAGTPAGSCVAQALRAASVPPFDGEPVTVSTTLHLR